MEGAAISARTGGPGERLLIEIRRSSNAALAGTLLSILALTAMRAAAAGPGAVRALLELLLVVSFVALAILDLRWATLVAVFELALAGASGRWVELPGGISGRIFIDTVVVVGGGAALALDRLRGEQRVLGRYGAHALLLAVAFPVVWMGVGLAEGNGVSNIWNDGNGLVFFAFALVIVLLVRRGAAAWLRRVFFAACVANAVVTGVLFAVGAAGVVSANALRTVLETRLEMGGAVGHMPNGAFRIYLGSGLYLQLGLALVLWQLLRTPRSLWLWALSVLFWVALYATYTRGLWVAGAVAAVLVLALSTPSARRATVLAGSTVAFLAIAVGIAAAGGIPLTKYLTGRVSSIAASGVHFESRRTSKFVNGGFEAPRGWGVHGGAVMHATATRSLAGRLSAEVVDRAAGADAYVSQRVYLEPNRLYRFSAAVDARGFRAPAAAHRGLVVWDVADGYVYRARLEAASRGWRRLGIVFRTPPSIRLFEVRLYAPQGTVYWDDARLEVVGPALQPEVHLAPDSAVRVTGRSLTDPGFEASAGWSLHSQPAASRVRFARTRRAATGRYAGQLTNARRFEDDFLFQTIPAAPRHLYRVSARVNAARFAAPAAGNRGLLVWDAANGVTWSAPVATPTRGWTQLGLTFVSGPVRGPLQIRLYSPQGVVRWDDVRVTDGGAAGDPPAVITGFVTPPSSAGVDTAGELSNGIKIRQAKILWRHVEHRPILGSGFGAIATDYPYSRSYAYELTYLDLLFKTGFVGLLLYLSFPLRVILEAVLGRLGRVRLAQGVSRHEAAVVVALVASVLVAGATNPYLLAAFGLWPLLISIAWLQPAPDRP
jgi:hypothetical protein